MGPPFSAGGALVSLDNPYVLLALPALLPLAFLSSRRFARRSRAFFALIGRRDREGALSETELLSRSRTAIFCFIASLASALIALSGPRWGDRLIPEYRRGLNVVIAMDISRSMDAKDVFPSRLKRASVVAREFVDASPGTRFSVVLGKGDGVVAVPLTDDRESVLSLLSNVSSETMTSRGTDLERLIETAVKAFPASSAARRLVVVFSDGEGLSGDASEAAGRAANAGILIAAVGVGTASGAAVPLGPAAKGVVRSAEGTPVKSVLKESVLRSIVEPSGGAYFDGSRVDTGASLARLASELSSVAAADGFRKEPIPRYRLFLLLSLLFLAASKAAESVPRKRRP